MRSALCLALALSLWMPVAASAQLEAAREEAAQAGQAYDAADYGKAAELYESALEHGLDAAVVHYNLGNARFKQGQLGQAIASYLRAARIDPRDPRIRTNLNRARAQIKDVELSGHDLPPMLRPFQWGYAHFSANEWWASALALLFLLCALRVLHQWRPLAPSLLQPATRVLVVLLLVTGLTGGVRHYLDFVVHRAVVVSDEVEVRSGPGSGYNLAFRVHAGLALRVAEDRGDWLRIDLGGELVGWVPATSLETI